MFHKIKWTVLFLFLSFSSLFGQEFVKSKAIALFNEGRFEEVVRFAKNWMNTHPEEASVAAYFSAESYYNLGIDNPQIGEARQAFRNAYKLFDKISNDAVFRQEYPHFYEMAVYKKGWCLFRRAETGENHVTLFKLAANDFSTALPLAPDSLKPFLVYMASEAKYQDATLKFYTYFRNLPDAGRFSGLQRELDQAKSGFEKTPKMVGVPRDLKIAALIRAKDCLFLSGKLFQNLSNAIFHQMNFSAKAASATQTARAFFAKADYLSINNGLTASEKKSYGQALLYLQAMRDLNLHWVNGGTKSVAQFKKLLAGLRRIPEFQSEILFRRGNLVQTDASVDSKDFFDLGNNKDSFYAKASKNIPEAFYWLGVVQDIRNDYNDSRENLVKFVKANPFPILDPRLEILVEDAKLRKYSIDFEDFSTKNDRNGLRELKNALSNFTPHDQRIQKEKQKLFGLVRLESGENLWTQILAGSPEQKLQVALDMIRDILPRAAVTTGQKRDHYLRQLDKIFEVTGHQKSNETVFYKGIALALRAEIQPSQQQKDNTFIAAAKLLSGVKSPYDLEAKYVAARSNFFAGRYDQAEEGFKFLVNKAHSLRSLYYLGEIYRLRKNYAAARKCFETIMAKVKNRPDGRFWYDNARASLEKCRSGGNLQEINTLDLADVQFPDDLLVINGEKISYEKLANPAYLEKQALGLANAYLKKFGLPKKTLYPSLNLLRRSVLRSENLFAKLNAGIQDKKGAFLATLKLWIVNENGKLYPADVWLKGQKLPDPKPGNPYVVEKLPLNQALLLRIEPIGYYNILREIRLVHPDENQVVVALTPRISFDKLEKELPLSNSGSVFRPNVDKLVLLEQGMKIPKPSALFEDFNRFYSFRDLYFNQALGEYLIVDAFQNTFRPYDASGANVPGPTSVIDLPDSIGTLNQPEAVATDLEGRTYIADWGNHRIVVLKKDGSFLRQIRHYKKVESDGSIRTKSFYFPSGVAVEDDASGIRFQGNTIHRPGFIYVSDLFGIHKIDSAGFEVDVYFPQPSGHPADQFSRIFVDNYGANARLFLRKYGKEVIEIFGAVKRIQ